MLTTDHFDIPKRLLAGRSLEDSTSKLHQSIVGPILWSEAQGSLIELGLYVWMWYQMSQHDRLSYFL